VREHELFLDESFRGWGVDDLEWGFRVCAAGIPIVLAPDVRALHLPHARDVKANQRAERQNYRRFLRKWPRWDVELAATFGDVEANRIFLEFVRELRGVDGGAPIGVALGVLGDRRVLYIGVRFAEKERNGASLQRLFGENSGLELLPLAGLALPFDDGSIDECRVLPPISELSASYRDKVMKEAARVARVVLEVDEPTTNGARTKDETLAPAPFATRTTAREWPKASNGRYMRAQSDPTSAMDEPMPELSREESP
jgi:hypothetical protein